MDPGLHRVAIGLAVFLGAWHEARKTTDTLAPSVHRRSGLYLPVRERSPVRIA